MSTTNPRPGDAFQAPAPPVLLDDVIGQLSPDDMRLMLAFFAGYHDHEPEVFDAALALTEVEVAR